MKKLINRLKNWNKLISFIVSCRKKENSQGIFQLLTTRQTNGKIRLIIIHTDVLRQQIDNDRIELND